MFMYINREEWRVMYTCNVDALDEVDGCLYAVVYQLQKDALNWSCGAHLIKLWYSHYVSIIC